MATVRRDEPPALAEEPLAAEEQAFLEQRMQLLQQYEGEYVAVYHERVVGHGSDDEELARRLFEELGDVPFYIGKVERRPTIHELPSPEVVG